jgi:hypothetical protein
LACNFKKGVKIEILVLSISQSYHDLPNIHSTAHIHYQQSPLHPEFPEQRSSMVRAVEIIEEQLRRGIVCVVAVVVLMVSVGHGRGMR